MSAYLPKRLKIDSSEKITKYYTDNLTLKYGIEIESVFELIDEYNAYNQFVKFYLANIEYNNDNINSTIESFMEILNKCIEEYAHDNIEYISEIQTNDIYIALTNEKIIKNNIEMENRERIKMRNINKNEKNVPVEDDKGMWSNLFNFSQEVEAIEERADKIEEEPDKIYINNYLTTNLKKLFTVDGIPYIRDETGMPADTVKFISDWHKFLNIGIIIIKNKLETIESRYNIGNLDYSPQDVIYLLLNIPKRINNIYIDFENIFDLKNTKIKLYDTTDASLSSFYRQQQGDDEILLNLTNDSSVVCDDALAYKNIISGSVVKYNYLFNKCEFITQPFNSIEDIKKKLSIFFEEPIINKTLLNCYKTSQHVHISFNNSGQNTRPNLYLILILVCVCYYFQDSIFDLILITRSNNNYCKKLNYHETLLSSYYELNEGDDYDISLINISRIFYQSFDEFLHYKFNRYYWLNLFNLYNLQDTEAPHTIEFRLKHGSTDANELSNVCTLYKNIINFSIKLLKNNSSLLDNKINIKEFKSKIEAIIDRSGKDNIFHSEILKDIDEYFTSPSSKYVIGLNKLNNIFRETVYSGGKFNRFKQNVSISMSSLKSAKKTQNIGKFIKSFINTLESKQIYRMNSFGYERIGIGLEDNIKQKLKNEFSFYRNLTNNKLKEYLKSHNIFYDIKSF